MTGAEHYAEAERLVTFARGEDSDYYMDSPVVALLLAEAQVHATLALASATSILEPSVARPFGHPAPVATDPWATPLSPGGGL